MNSHYLHKNYHAAKCSYLAILILVNLVKEDIQTLYSWLPERTLDYLFSPLATYCEIFHTHKPMGLLSGGLNNVNLRYTGPKNS